MFSSVRIKLLFFMTINVLIFGILLYGSNSIFAKKYYTESKKKLLVENSIKIKKIIKDKDIVNGWYENDIIYEINRVEKNIGGVVAIGKLDGTLYYPTPQSPNQPPRPGMNENPFFILNDNYVHILEHVKKGPKPPKMDIKYWERYHDDSFFIKLQDPNMRIETLRFQTKLENGLTLLIWIPMEQISESVSVSNTFTGIVALITIILSGIWTLFISKNFTNPITKMNCVAEKMANLDFSETITIKGKDEIAQLSKSINHLSHKLDTSISELNVKNKKLEQDIHRERKIDKLRKEFISSVSHDLKTPIFLIQGYAEGIKSNIAQNEEKRNFYCDVIIEETEKMDTLVKDLLDLSQMESGLFKLERADFDMAVLINDLIKKMDTIIHKSNINVEINTNNHIMVNADPLRIEQIMTNLICNAINHVDENKILRITVEKYHKKFKVFVYNTGKHIPASSMEKIWTSFYKIDKARTREYGGSGLGLSIVRAIQKAHHNEFGVSNIHKGVEFWFDLDQA